MPMMNGSIRFKKALDTEREHGNVDMERAGDKQDDISKVALLPESNHMGAMNRQHPRCNKGKKLVMVTKVAIAHTQPMLYILYTLRTARALVRLTCRVTDVQ
jgi:hypothetical protein